MNSVLIGWLKRDRATERADRVPYPLLGNNNILVCLHCWTFQHLKWFGDHVICQTITALTTTIFPRPKTSGLIQGKVILCNGNEFPFGLFG